MAVELTTKMKHDVLKGAKKRIKLLKNWTTGTYHEIKDDPSGFGEIHAYCVIGAVKAEANILRIRYKSENPEDFFGFLTEELLVQEIEEVLRECSYELFGQDEKAVKKVGVSHFGPVDVNDVLGHAAVMKVLDCGIKKTEG